LVCSWCWNVGKYEFSQTFFETESFTSSLPKTSIQRSWKLERRVKEPVIQIPWNFWVPYTLQFIGLFGYIWLLYKFVSSAILASSSSVRKNVLEKLMGSTDLQNLFWQFLIFLESEGRFQRLYSPHYTFTFCRMGFCIFQMFLLLYMMPVMCLELQKIRHFRCLPLSSGTWSFSINLLSADSQSSNFWWQIFAFPCSAVSSLVSE